MKHGPRRNDPCPCGSGRKYKQCCLARDEVGRAGRARAERLKALSVDLTNRIFEFAYDRCGDLWVGAAFEPLFEPEELAEFVVPYAAHHVPFEGRTAAEWYRDENEAELSPDERACLDAERASWLTIWEVMEVREGDGLTLRDRLSGQVHDVIDRTASRTAQPGMTLLARLVEFAGFMAPNGFYPFSLPGPEADEVERRMRGHLRRKRDVPVERLREPKAMRYLIRRFDEEVDLLRAGPALVNSDGHPILFTTDHFRVAAGSRDELFRRLGALEDVMGPEPCEDGSEGFVFLGPDQVLLGNVIVAERRLQLETNSVERADRLRRTIERACAGLVEHLAREHMDPLSSARSSEEDEDPPASTPETREITRFVKQRYYEDWLDTEVPMLGGRTPREAAATSEGRTLLDTLLRQIEEAERTLHPDERLDVEVLRRVLGLRE